MEWILGGIIVVLLFVIGFLIYCINSAAGAAVKFIKDLGRNR